MKIRQLFFLLFAAILSSAAFADEIGSGRLDPAGSSAMTTAPDTEIDDPNAAAGETNADGESLLQQFLDWIA